MHPAPPPAVAAPAGPACADEEKHGGEKHRRGEDGRGHESDHEEHAVGHQQKACK
jgi:hypothetical protein